MTGFARVRQTTPQAEIVLSIKSVNHRGLDMHFHMPPELDPLESELRSTLKRAIARGHLQIHLLFSPTPESAPAPLNRPLLDSYLRAYREAAEAYQLAGQPDLNSALRLPGMLGAATREELDESVAGAVLAAAREAAVLLNAVREREGEAIAGELGERCRAICGLVERMEQIRAGSVPAFQKRLHEKLSDLLRGPSIDPQRLAQEAAILADRSDISEELLRLRTHTEQLAGMLAAGGEVGKRLDFLLQEMNRESNTILSKTGGLGDLGLTITELALAAKSEIDKIREQALNLE
ncbi:MAG: YicC family protein [Terriglobia bacterium]|nr:MAG: YicC family protein [Terriglobia bacterium]